MVDLISQKLPIKDISEKYNFSSVPHFYAFCKKEFKKTPAQIRENTKK